MKNSVLPKFLLLFIILAASHFHASSQNCSVGMDSLKGDYTGDCKNGKANGKGKAVGTNTYVGQFKAGLPDGEGTYTWSNGNSFTGSFKKGLKNGYGILTYKETRDTTEGYWENDQYKGRYEYPFKVIFKTIKVTKAEIKPAVVDGSNQIKIWISSTGAGGSSLGGTVPKIGISNLTIQKGGYIRSYQNTSYNSKSETILYDAWFPLRMQIDMGTQSAEVEINEAGSYLIDITLNTVQ